jgi:hypothetical protein
LSRVGVPSDEQPSALAVAPSAVALGIAVPHAVAGEVDDFATAAWTEKLEAPFRKAAGKK